MLIDATQYADLLSTIQSVGNMVAGLMIALIVAVTWRG